MTKIIIGGQLRALRSKEGISQQTLAEKIFPDIHPKTAQTRIKSYEIDNGISEESFQCILDYYKMTKEEFFKVPPLARKKQAKVKYSVPDSIVDIIPEIYDYFDAIKNAEAINEKSVATDLMLKLAEKMYIRAGGTSVVKNRFSDMP